MSRPGVKNLFKESEPFRWEGVPLLPYKEEGTHFRDVTRQILFPDEGVWARSYDTSRIAPGGWSSLERHSTCMR
jgi:hypothetical protein